MGEFNYKELFDKALMEIKAQRNPSAMRADECFYDWPEVKKNTFFDFGGRGQEEYACVVEYAKTRSITLICNMIGFMNQFFEKQLELVMKYDKEGVLKNTEFVVFDGSSKVLFLFKEMEECCFMHNGKPTDSIKSVIDAYGAVDYRFIYFLRDKAYLQQLGYEESLQEAGKGTKAYSLPYFFQIIFGDEETDKFMAAFDRYLEEVKEALGYSVTKTLTTDASVNFRTIVESRIIQYNYDQIGDMKIGRYEIAENDIPALKAQFIDKKYYQVLLGDQDFAESFVTAEWMYDSMAKAKAIDLSVIALGYFKAIEQLLFEVIKLYHSGPELNEDDYTLGSIAIYYKRFNSYADGIETFTKSYIKEAVFHYKDIRNGYSHKHNIKDKNKINEIRKETLLLIFLILGSHKLDARKLEKLGYVERTYENDFYYLCEYMNYHAGDAFYVYAGEREIMCFANNDLNIVNKGNHIEYSGVYILDMDSKAKFKITSESLPTKVVLARLEIKGKTTIEKLSFEKIKTIFENGKYVGPRVITEIEDKY